MILKRLIHDHGVKVDDSQYNYWPLRPSVVLPAWHKETHRPAPTTSPLTGEVKCTAADGTKLFTAAHVSHQANYASTKWGQRVGIFLWMLKPCVMQPQKWGQSGWKWLRETYAYITGKLWRGCVLALRFLLQLLPEVCSDHSSRFWSQAVIKALVGRQVTRRCCFTIEQTNQTSHRPVQTSRKRESCVKNP